jgi:hypothetical protein
VRFFDFVLSYVIRDFTHWKFRVSNGHKAEALPGWSCFAYQMFLSLYWSYLQVKEYLANPEAFAAAVGPAVTEAKPVEEAKEEETKEEDEESEGDMVSSAEDMIRLKLTHVHPGLWIIRLNDR